MNPSFVPTAAQIVAAAAEVHNYDGPVEDPTDADEFGPIFAQCYNRVNNLYSPLLHSDIRRPALVKFQQIVLEYLFGLAEWVEGQTERKPGWNETYKAMVGLERLAFRYDAHNDVHRNPTQQMLTGCRGMTLPRLMKLSVLADRIRDELVSERTVVKATIEIRMEIPADAEHAVEYVRRMKSKLFFSDDSLNTRVTSVEVDTTPPPAPESKPKRRRKVKE